MSSVSGKMIWFLVALCATTSQAAETLTWQECLREATLHNPELQSARAAVESAKYQIKSASAGYFPQLSANLNGTYGTTKQTAVTGTSSTSGTTIGFTPGGSGNGMQTNFSASIAATQNLFSGLQTLGSVHEAEANERTAEANLKTAQAKVSNDLVSAYMGLIYAQNSIKLSQDITLRRQDNLKMVQLRYENGNENKGSLLLSQAYLEQAKFEALQALDARTVAERQLNQVLGRDQEDELEVTGTAPTQEPPARVDLKQLAVQTPAHFQAVAQEDSADAAVTVARAPLFPSLSLVASAGTNGPNFFPNDSDNWSVGFNISYPFFSGGRDYFATQSALENLKSASFNHDNVDRTLLSQLKQGLVAYTEAVQKLRVDQSFLEASTVREKIGRAQYNNGLLSFQEWDIIENDLITRQKTVLQSERERVTSESTWNQVQGKGVIQ